MTFSTKDFHGIIYLSCKGWNRDQNGIEAVAFSHMLYIPYFRTKLIHQHVKHTAFLPPKNQHSPSHKLLLYPMDMWRTLPILNMRCRMEMWRGDLWKARTSIICHGQTLPIPNNRGNENAINPSAASRLVQSERLSLWLKSASSWSHCRHPPMQNCHSEEKRQQSHQGGGEWGWARSTQHDLGDNCK